METAISPDDGAFADRGKGEDAGPLANDGGRMNEGPRIDAVRFLRGFTTDVPNDQHESFQGVFDGDNGHAIGGHRSGHNGGRGATAVQAAGVFVILDKSDVSGLGIAQGPGGVNGDVAIAVDDSLNQVREFLDGKAHWSVLSSMKDHRS